MRNLLVPALVAAFTCTAAAAATIAELNFDEGDGTSTANQAPDGPGTSITGATWADGEDGKALEFKGPDYSGPYRPPGTFVTLNDSAGLNPNGKVTVAVSVYPTFNPVAWGGIVEKGVGYGSSFRLLMLRNGKVRAAVGNEHLTVDSPEPLELDAWTRLEMTFDGKTLALSVGGTEVAKTAAKPESMASEASIEIGRRFTGRIDNVMIEY